jgi:hypothetical protein
MANLFPCQRPLRNHYRTLRLTWTTAWKPLC